MTGAVTAVICAAVSVVWVVTPACAAAGAVQAVTAVIAVTRPSVGARPDLAARRVSRVRLHRSVRATEVPPRVTWVRLSAPLSPLRPRCRAVVATPPASAPGSFHGGSLEIV